MRNSVIVSTYTGTGALDNSYRPFLADMYSVAEWVDQTGIPVANIIPDVTTFTISVQCADVTYTQISRDHRFTIVAEPPEEQLIEELLP